MHCSVTRWLPKRTSSSSSPPPPLPPQQMFIQNGIIPIQNGIFNFFPFFVPCLSEKCPYDTPRLKDPLGHHGHSLPLTPTLPLRPPFLTSQNTRGSKESDFFNSCVFFKPITKSSN